MMMWGKRKEGYPSIVRIAGVHFEREELSELMLASLALLVAFTWPSLLKLPVGILLGFIVFPLHEIAHKLVGFTYGYPTRFKAHLPGMLVILLSSFLTQGTFIVGYAGYVEVLSRRVERHEMANIALAGPLVNILSGLILACLNDIFPFPIPFLKLGGLVCIGVGIFNLVLIKSCSREGLIIRCFDGKWVLSYSKKLWIAAIGLGLISFLLVFFT
jgi:hypothetical protein